MHLKTLIDQLTQFANLETCPVRDECQPGFVAGAYWGWGQARNRIAQILKQHPLGASATDFQSGYSIALQRAIEHHCGGLAVPPEIAADCPHHAKLLDGSLEYRAIAENSEGKVSPAETCDYPGQGSAFRDMPEN